jgi:hypothetical protein
VSDLIAVTRVRAAFVPLLAALVLPAGASATTHGPLHGRVPARESAIFRALKKPAVRSLPKRVRRALANGHQFQAVGADPTQARQVGTTEHPLYLVPGTEGICLVLDSGSVCSPDLAHVAAYGLSVDIVNTTRNPDGTTNLWGDVVTVGVAPNGYDAISVTTQAGGTASGAIVNNSYRVATNGPIALRTLSGPGVSPITE